MLWGHLTGLLRPAWARWRHGQPHLGWEYAWAGGTAAAMVIRMWVPGTIPPGLIERAVEAAWPGTRTVTAPAGPPLPPRRGSCRGTLRLGRPEILPLSAGHDPEAPLRALAGAAAGLADGEHAIVQVLTRPVTGSRLRRARRAARRQRAGQPARTASRLLDLASPGHGTARTRAASRPDPGLAAEIRETTAKLAGPQWETLIRRLDVRWRSSIDSPRHYAYVAIDGRGWLLNLLIARLDRDLPAICEAIEDSPRTPALRRRLAHHFVQIAIDRRLCRDDFKPEGWIPHLQARKRPTEQFGHYLLECPEAPDLQQRLAVTERMLVDWYFDEVAPEVMIEELHTAFELTLARIIYGRYRRDKAFQELIDEAAARGAFDNLRDFTQFVPGFDFRASSREPPPPTAPYLAELLTSLKDTRKQVRHRVATSARAWLNEHVDAVALEELAPSARTLPPAG